MKDLGTLSLNWDISIISLSSGLRKSSGRGSGKAVRARGDDIKETRPSKHNRANNRISAETMAACTGSAWGCARRDFRAERRSGHMSPSPTRKLCPVDSHLQMTNQFSPKVSLVIQTTLPARPQDSGRWSTQWHLLRFFVSKELYTLFKKPYRSFSYILWLVVFFFFLGDSNVYEYVCLWVYRCISWFFFDSSLSVCLFCFIIILCMPIGF